MRRSGHWLRWIGLLIEIVGGAGVLRERGGQPAPQISIPGGPVVSAAWVLVGLGFFLWMVGRLLLATVPPSRRDPS